MTTPDNAPTNGEKGTVLPIPLDVLSTPRDGVVLTDRWWVVQDGCALFWKGSRRRRGWSPQCNHDRRLPDSLTARYPGSTVEFVPAAYVGREDEEWGYLLTSVILASASAEGGGDDRG